MTESNDIIHLKTVSLGKLRRCITFVNPEELTQEEYINATRLFTKNSPLSKCNLPKKNYPPSTPEQIQKKQEMMEHARIIRQEKREARHREMKEKYDLKDDEWFCETCNKKLKKTSLFSHNNSARHWKFVTCQPISLAGGKTRRQLNPEESKLYQQMLKQKKASKASPSVSV
jgi:hypothetical protein